MTTIKFPTNLQDPTSLLYEVYSNQKNLTNVCVLMQDEHGSFKLVVNEYDPTFIAISAAALNGLAAEMIWSHAKEGDLNGDGDQS